MNFNFTYATLNMLATTESHLSKPHTKKSHQQTPLHLHQIIQTNKEKPNNEIKYPESVSSTMQFVPVSIVCHQCGITNFGHVTQPRVHHQERADFENEMEERYADLEKAEKELETRREAFEKENAAKKDALQTAQTSLDERAAALLLREKGLDLHEKELGLREKELSLRGKDITQRGEEMVQRERQFESEKKIARSYRKRVRREAHRLSLSTAFSAWKSVRSCVKKEKVVERQEELLALFRKKLGNEKKGMAMLVKRMTDMEQRDVTIQKKLRSLCHTVSRYSFETHVLKQNMFRIFCITGATFLSHPLRKHMGYMEEGASEFVDLIFGKIESYLKEKSGLKEIAGDMNLLKDLNPREILYAANAFIVNQNIDPDEFLKSFQISEEAKNGIYVEPQFESSVEEDLLQWLSEGKLCSP
jgi:hypothetical protein